MSAPSKALDPVLLRLAELGAATGSQLYRLGLKDAPRAITGAKRLKEKRTGLSSRAARSRLATLVQTHVLRTEQLGFPQSVPVNVFCPEHTSPTFSVLGHCHVTPMVGWLRSTCAVALLELGFEVGRRNEEVRRAFFGEGQLHWRCMNCGHMSLHLAARTCANSVAEVATESFEDSMLAARHLIRRFTALEETSTSRCAYAPFIDDVQLPSADLAVRPAKGERLMVWVDDGRPITEQAAEIAAVTAEALVMVRSLDESIFDRREGAWSKRGERLRQMLRAVQQMGRKATAGGNFGHLRVEGE